jgi:hypothetical protein
MVLNTDLPECVKNEHDLGEDDALLTVGKRSDKKWPFLLNFKVQMRGFREATKSDLKFKRVRSVDSREKRGFSTYFYLSIYPHIKV